MLCDIRLAKLSLTWLSWWTCCEWCLEVQSIGVNELVSGGHQLLVSDELPGVCCFTTHDGDGMGVFKLSNHVIKDCSAADVLSEYFVLVDIAEAAFALPSGFAVFDDRDISAIGDCATFRSSDDVATACEGARDLATQEV